MNILQAMGDPNVFAPHFRGPSWKAWKSALAAIFALPMDANVGRRGGKSRVLALIAVYLATANKAQARSIFRFVIGLLKAVPLIKPMIEDDNTEQITLSNRVIIEIATASFRTTRGYSYAAVLADEVAFWRSEESSANPDVEIMRAVRPGMASIPGSILLGRCTLT